MNDGKPLSLNRLIGLLLVAVSAAAFGTLAILGKYALAEGMGTPTILFLRFALAAVLMLGLLAARRERLPRGSALLILVGMGAVGYVGQAMAYLTALQYASAGLVALLLYLYPVFVAILSVVVLHERLTRLKALALGLATLGVALTVSPQGGQLKGVVLAIMAALIYSVYILAGARVMKHVSVYQSSFVIFASAGVVCGIIMAAGGGSFPTTPTGWWVILAMVLVATVLPVTTFLAGLNRIGATNAAMVSTLEPVVTVVLAAWLLDEVLPTAAILGGALILAAVLLLARGEMRSSQETARIHE
jgi:drug/metabolite transporter (DMT)-like permease